MNSGPFQSKQAGTIIANFMKDELLPLNEELQVLAIDVSSLQIGFFESFTRKRLDELEKSYIDSMTRFMRAYQKWFDPDELFKGVKTDDAQGTAVILGDYFRSRQANQKHFDEGFRLLGHIDRIISGKKYMAYNRVAMFLSILAITVAIVVVIFQF